MQQQTSQQLQQKLASSQKQLKGLLDRMIEPTNDQEQEEADRYYIERKHKAKKDSYTVCRRCMLTLHVCNPTCKERKTKCTYTAKRCARCKQVEYCDKKCQEIDWSRHQKECKPCK